MALSYINFQNKPSNIQQGRILFKIFVDTFVVPYFFSEVPKMFLDSFACLLSCFVAGLGRGCEILYKKVWIRKIS